MFSRRLLAPAAMAMVFLAAPAMGALVPLDSIPAHGAPPADNPREIDGPELPGQIWIPGHYEYEEGRYLWIAGHYEPERDGHRYVAPRYENGRFYLARWERAEPVTRTSSRPRVAPRASKAG